MRSTLFLILLCILVSPVAAVEYDYWINSFDDSLFTTANGTFYVYSGCGANYSNITTVGHYGVDAQTSNCRFEDWTEGGNNEVNLTRNESYCDVFVDDPETEEYGEWNFDQLATPYECVAVVRVTAENNRILNPLIDSDGDKGIRWNHHSYRDDLEYRGSGVFTKIADTTIGSYYKILSQINTTEVYHLEVWDSAGVSQGSASNIGFADAGHDGITKFEFGDASSGVYSTNHMYIQSYLCRPMDSTFEESYSGIAYGAGEAGLFNVEGKTCSMKYGVVLNSRTNSTKLNLSKFADTNLVISDQNVAPPAGNFTFISQDPANITTTNLFESRLNITYNSSSDIRLNYTVNSTSRTYLIHVNGTSQTVMANKSYDLKDGVDYSFYLGDNDVYPATYNYNETYMEDTTHINRTLNDTIHFMKIELLNVSNMTPHNFFEIMANNTGNQSIDIFYCNDSYTMGNPSVDTDCSFIYSIPGTEGYAHCHGADGSAKSCHHIVPFPIEAGEHNGITVTQTSYFLVQGRPGLSNVDVWGIGNVSRADAIQLSTDNASSWTSLAYTPDAHLHQFDTSNTIYYNVYNSSLSSSDYRSDYFDYAPIPPTSPSVVEPTQGEIVYNDSSSNRVNWTAAIPSTGHIDTYDMYLTDLQFNRQNTIATGLSNSSTNYYFDLTNLDSGEYRIEVVARGSNGQNSSGYSPAFNLSDTDINLLNPASDLTVFGTNVFIEYSVTTNANQTCHVFIDGKSNATDYIHVGGYQTFDSTQTKSHTLELEDGVHNYSVSCSPYFDPTFSTNTSNRTFYFNVAGSYIYSLNLSDGPESIFENPQRVFYDINGDITVLYFIDDAGDDYVKLKTINSSNEVSQAYDQQLNRTEDFYVLIRESNNSKMLTFNNAEELTHFINFNGHFNITNHSMAPGVFGHGRSVLGNSYWDPYTYANTKHFETIDYTAGSYYLFILPTTTDGARVIRNNISQTTLQNITDEAHTWPDDITWQTLANDSSLETWIYPWPKADGGNYDIALYSYNGSASSEFAVIDNGDYTIGQIENSIVALERYIPDDGEGNATYAMVTNATNKMIIYHVESGNSATINEQISNPSHLFFVTNDTFVFFNREGGATNAYTCYFDSSPSCNKFTETEYGYSVPYLRGSGTTTKRDGTDDVVTQGVIATETETVFYYNEYNYDLKFICYDEQDEYRQTFDVQVYADNDSAVLENQAWGWVFPSEILGSGQKRAYNHGENGTSRLYLVGLNTFRLDFYSLNETQGQYYTFEVQDNFQQNLEGVIITAKRFSNDKKAWVIVEQGVTDYSGTATLFLQQFRLYQITISKDGYTTINFDFNPATVFNLEIILATDTDEQFELPNYYYLWDDVSYSVTPSDSYMSRTVDNATFTVDSAGGNLEYFGMRIRKSVNGTTTTVYTNNLTASPAGGKLNYSMNESGTYYIDTWFKHQNHSKYTPITKAYYIKLGSNQSLLDARDTLIDDSPISGWSWYFIGVIFTMLVAGFVSRYTIDGAGVVGLMVLWGFTLMNPGVELVCMGGISGVCITPFIASSLTTVVTAAVLYLRQNY
jgi:hypothetical protein